MSMRRYNKKNKNSSKRVNIMSKLMRLNTCNLYYGFREVNELEAGAGKLTLQNNALGNVKPLHIFPLNSIINKSTTPFGGFVLKQNGYDFSSLGNVEFLGADGAISASPATQELQSTLLRYNNIKLLFWSSPARKTTFRCSIVKIFDEDFIPSTTAITDVNIQNKVSLFYDWKMLRSLTSNPIVANENIGKQLKGKVKILWSKDYQIDELLNDRDEHHYKEVKIFRKEDKICHYKELPVINAAPSIDDPDVVRYDNFETNTTTYPLTPQQTYLIITANTTLSQAEDAVNFHTATYDINIKNKHTVSERIF